MNAKPIILFLAFIIAINGFSQDTVRDHNKVDKGYRNLSVLFGYNMWRHHFAEVGFAINEIERIGYKYGGRIISVSTEIKLDNVLVMGPKIGFWIGGDTGGFGLNAIYYTDFSEGALRLRPELGIGLSSFKIAYGYNISLSNKEFMRVNKSNLTLYLLLPLLKLREGTL